MMNRLRAHSAKVAPFAAGLASVLLLASCGNEESTSEAEPEPNLESASVVLARVGDLEVTRDDFEAEAHRRQAQGRPVPGKAELLEEMVEREAFLFRARQAGLECDEEVRRQIENLLISRLHGRELERRLRAVEVSEAELQATYEARVAEFTRPAKVRVALLHLKAGKGASAQKRAEVLARVEEAREKALSQPVEDGRGAAARGFGSLAIDYSEDHTSRYRGGDIGWLNEGSLDHHWPRPVLEAAYAGEVGKVSEILDVGGDFYLVMKTDYREAFVQPLSEVRRVLQAGLLREKRQALQDAFRAETRRLASVSIDQSALDALEAPVAAPPGPDSPGQRPPGFPLSASN